MKVFFGHLWEDDYVVKVDEAIYQVQFPKTICISCWNVAGTLNSPKGMQSHSKKPKLPTVNAVYCFDNLCILICQNPDFRSRHEKWLAPTRLSNASWILQQWVGVFLCVGIKTGGNLYKNVDLCPTFEWTLPHYTMHSGWGQIMPESNISCRCVQNFFHQWWGNLSESFFIHGVLLVTLITCSVEWVQPSLLGSKEKMSLWYSARRDQVESASALVAKNPTHLNPAPQTISPAICFTVNLGIWRL